MGLSGVVSLFIGQNLKRKLSCADRMGRTDNTWPNVGELTFVSTAA